MPRLDQLLGDRGRNAVADEPLGDPLRPVGRPPHPLALGVVERTLDHRRARRRSGGLGAADVVRVHVRDEDPHNRAVQSGEDLLPRRLHQAETGVDECPAGVAAQEVAVHVTRARGQGQGQTQDSRLQLDWD